MESKGLSSKHLRHADIVKILMTWEPIFWVAVPSGRYPGLPAAAKSEDRRAQAVEYVL